MHGSLPPASSLVLRGAQFFFAPGDQRNAMCGLAQSYYIPKLMKIINHGMFNKKCVRNVAKVKG